MSYIIGGLIPLFPYFIFKESSIALRISVVSTLIALFIFGYIKGQFTGLKPMRSAYQTALIGGLSATAAFILAQLLK